MWTHTSLRSAAFAAASIARNAAWHALCETHTQDGKRAIPDAECCTHAAEQAVLPADTPVLSAPVRGWLGEFLPAVAAGRMDLDELLHRVDEDLQFEPMLWPWCSTGHYRGSSGPAWRQGICLTCYLNKLRETHEEKLHEIESKMEVTAIKRAVSRARDRLDPERPARMHRSVSVTCAAIAYHQQADGASAPAKPVWSVQNIASAPNAMRWCDL